jgi:hypothetical protein
MHQECLFGDGEAQGWQSGQRAHPFRRSVGPRGCRNIHLLRSACWRHLQLHAIASHADGWFVRINVIDDLRSKAHGAVVAFAASLCDSSAAVAIVEMEKTRDRSKQVPRCIHGGGRVAVVVFSCLWRIVDAAPGSATDIQHCSHNGNLRRDFAQRPSKSYPAAIAALWCVRTGIRRSQT